MITLSRDADVYQLYATDVIQYSIDCSPSTKNCQLSIVLTDSLSKKIKVKTIILVDIPWDTQQTIHGYLAEGRPVTESINIEIPSKFHDS